MPWLLAIVAIAGAIWLSYSPYRRDLHQPQADWNVGPLVADRIVSQQFVANVYDLARIDLLFGTYNRRNSSSLVLALDSIPPDDSSFRAVWIDTDSLRDNSYYQWRFQPLPRSAGRQFVLSVWSPDAGEGQSVTLWASKENAYPEGILSIGNAPMAAASINFSTYSYWPVSRLVSESWLALAGRPLSYISWLIALLGPGVVVWALFRRPTDALGDMPLALTLSLGLAPALLLWGVATPLRLVNIDPWIVPILLVVALFAGLYKTAQAEPAAWLWPALTAGVAGLTVLTRLTLYGDQSYPMWGDSVQQVAATELFLRNDGLPASWSPLAPLESFTYHFAFHLWSADLARFFGLSSASAVVAAGFILVGLSAWASGYLAEAMSGQPVAGPVAALLTGFIMPFPSFLLNWGRYPQLFSVVILASLLGLVLRDLQAGSSWRQTPIYALLFTGLFLSHYRTALLGATLVLVALLALRRKAGPLVTGGVLASLATLPWLMRLFEQPPVTRSAMPAAADWLSIYNAVGDPLFFTPAWALALAAVGLIIVGSVHFARTFLLVLWGGLAWVLASINLPNYPAGSLVNHFFLESSAYLVITPLAAIAIAWALERTSVLVGQATAGRNIPLEHRRSTLDRPLARSTATALPVGIPTAFRPALAALIVGLAIGLSTNPNVAPDSRHRLVYQADIQAMDWLRKNIGQQDKALAMSEIAMGGSAVVGTDAGWWLPIEGVETQLPPVIYLIERLSPAQSEWIRLMASIDSRGQPLDPDVWLPYGFRYLYVGVANRWTGIISTRPIQLIYDQGGARIYDLGKR